MLFYRQLKLWANVSPLSQAVPCTVARRVNSYPGGRLFSSFHSKDDQFVKVSEEVRAAIAGTSLDTRPVVALETAIYTHGFPYPENIALASHLESVVRLNGGIPATIGILNGVACVGLETEELIELASSAGRPETKKVSTRDLSYIGGLGLCGKRLNGGTTVAGTMVLAHKAGIKIFATGGLGGVHRGAEKSMDISADLVELERTPVTVVSSGCKSFLDIPRTLEFLETQGVTVATFADGRKGNVDFPAFWTRDSGIASPMTIENELEGAAMIYARNHLGIRSSMLLANPIPLAHSIDKERMDTIIAEAIDDAEKSGVSGHANTPFILKRIRELTGGGSIPANRALIEANVARGTRLAVEYQRLERRSGEEGLPKSGGKGNNILSSVSAVPRSSGSMPVSLSVGETKASIPDLDNTQSTARADVVAAGSLAWDRACDFIPESRLQSSKTPQLATSNPAVITESLGGVAQNVATTVHYLGTSVRLCSAVGEDARGTSAIETLSRRGMQITGIQKVGDGARTGEYVAINDARKDLYVAVADMIIQENVSMKFEKMWEPQLHLAQPKWLVVDATWSPKVLRKWVLAGKAFGAKVAFEPVSAAKGKRLFQPTEDTLGASAVIPDNLVSLVTPNAIELGSMHSAAADAGLFEREDWWRVIDAIGLSSAGSRDKLVTLTNSALVDDGVPQQSLQLLPFIPTILTKLGSQGVLMTQLLVKGDARLTSRESAPYILGHASNENRTIGGVYMRLFPPAEVVAEDDIVSVNGVGDTFLGIVLAGLAKEKPKDWPSLIDVAQRGSVMTLKCKETVSPDVSILSSLL